MNLLWIAAGVLVGSMAAGAIFALVVASWQRRHPPPV
jgi:hypothetical protein